LAFSRTVTFAPASTPSNADSPRTAETPYFVGDDLRCASCRKPADFEFTNEARMQVIAALITYAVGRRNGKDEHRGPPAAAFERELPVGDEVAPAVMAELQAAVAEDPHKLVN
jgi:hypothetical protein